MIKCNYIKYNWFCTQESGDDYQEHTVGHRDVVSITQHPDEQRYIITYKDGSHEIQSNINFASFDPPESEG